MWCFTKAPGGVCIYSKDIFTHKMCGGDNWLKPLIGGPVV